MSSVRFAIITASVVTHVGVGLALYASGIWDLERLGAQKPSGDLAVMTTPPPPAGGSPTSARRFINDPKRKIIELAQPTDEKPDLRSLITSVSKEPGNGAGTGSGTGDGPGDGPCVIEPCGAISDVHIDAPGNVPAIPKPAELRPDDVEALRISGDTQIEPTEHRRLVIAKAAIAQSKHRKSTIVHLTGTFKLCVSAEGTVTSVRLLKSTSYADYDNAIVSAMTDWRYRPYTLEGTAQPFCGVVQLNYNLDVAHYVEINGFRFDRD